MTNTHNTGSWSGPGPEILFLCLSVCSKGPHCNNTQSLNKVCRLDNRGALMLIFQFQKLNRAYGSGYPRSWETHLKYLGVKINKWKVPREVPCPALVMLQPGHTSAQPGTGQRGDPPPSTSSGRQPFSPGAQGQGRAVLAFASLPGLSLQVEDAGKIRPAVALSDPAPLWGKTNPAPTGTLWCWALLSFS